MLRGTPDHPKTLALMERLNVGKATAVGMLELLWHFTATYAPEGDVGRWPNEVISRASGWEGHADGFIPALVACGWLDEDFDHRLVVHDWHEHSDRYVRRRLARHGRTMVTPGAVNGRPKGGQEAAPPVPLPVPVPVPVPEPVGRKEPPAPLPPEQRAEDATKATIRSLQLKLGALLCRLAEHPNSRRMVPDWCREVTAYDKADGTRVRGVPDYRTVMSIDRLERSVADAEWHLGELEKREAVHGT